MSELYSKCPGPTRLIRERLERYLQKIRFSSFASLLGARTSFRNLEILSLLYEEQVWVSLEKKREIFTTIVIKNSKILADSSGLKHHHLYSRTAAAEEWV